MDLLEWLQSEISCEYISDMRSGEKNKLAKEQIKCISFEEYTLGQLSDAAGYLYGCSKNFETFEEARDFFIHSGI